MRKRARRWKECSQCRKGFSFELSWVYRIRYWTHTTPGAWVSEVLLIFYIPCGTHLVWVSEWSSKLQRFCWIAKKCLPGWPPPRIALDPAWIKKCRPPVHVCVLSNCMSSPILLKLDPKLKPAFYQLFSKYIFSILFSMTFFNKIQI